MKCKYYKKCAFRKAFGYCAKQIGEDCPVILEGGGKNDD